MDIRNGVAGLYCRCSSPVLQSLQPGEQQNWCLRWRCQLIWCYLVGLFSFS